MVLSHNFQECFLERQTLGCEFEDVDVRSDQEAHDFGEGIHGSRGEGQAVILNLRGLSPSSKSRKQFRAQISAADEDLDQIPLGPIHGGIEPAAYLPLYPECNMSFIDDAEVSEGLLWLHTAAISECIALCF